VVRTIISRERGIALVDVLWRLPIRVKWFQPRCQAAARHTLWPQRLHAHLPILGNANERIVNTAGEASVPAVGARAELLTCHHGPASFLLAPWHENLVLQLRVSPSRRRRRDCHGGTR